MWLFIVLWLFAQIIQLDGEWARIDDDAHYILHAQSLAVNHRYNDPNFVYIPEAQYVPKSTLPGWPLLLTPLLLVFGKNLVILKSVVVLIALISGLVLYRLFVLKAQDRRLSLLLTVIYLFLMSTIVYSRLIYSEWPYMLVSFAIIHLTRRENQKGVFGWVLIGLCLGMMLLFRSVAFSMVLAVIAFVVQEDIVFQQRFGTALKRLGIVLATAIVLYLGIQHIVRPEKGSGYKEQFLSKELYFPADGQATVGDILSRMPRNGQTLVQRIVPMFIGRSWHEYVEFTKPGWSRWSNRILVVSGVFILLLMLTGWFLQVTRKPSVMEYYVLFYMAMMSVVWFYTEAYRYLMPVAPFLVYYSIIGFGWIVSKWRKKPVDRSPIVYGVLVVLLAFNICQAGIEIYRYRFSPEYPRSCAGTYKATVSWLREQATPGTLIIADDSRWYALETERPVTTYLTSRDAEKTYRYLTKFPDAYLVVDEMRPLQRHYLVPIVKAHPDRFELVQSIGHIRIYRCRPEATSPEYV